MNRSFWLNLHLYLGLAAALPLVVVAVTGGVLALRPELQVLSYPDVYEVEAGEERMSAAGVARKLEATYPGITIFHTAVFQDPTRAWITFSSEGQLAVDPYSGEIHPVPEGRWLETVEQLHRALAAGVPGRYIVAVSSVILLLLLGSGLWLWIPMCRGTLERWWQRGTALAWHNVTGVAALPLLAVMAFTGITITFQLVPAVYWATGSPGLEQPAISQPTDREPIPIADAIETARGVYPEAVVTGFKEPWDSTQAHRVSFGNPDDLNQRGWLQVYVHPYSGDVIETVDTYEHSAGSIYQHTFFQFHTGEFFGLAGRIVWGIATMLLPLLVVTGVFRWWKKKRGVDHRSVSELIGPDRRDRRSAAVRTPAEPHGTASTSREQI